MARWSVKKWSHCTVQETSALWNMAFYDYPVPMMMSPLQLMTRMAQEELDPDLSFVVVDEARPIGFALNGIRTSADGLTAWNGGTAVLTKYRGQGVGSALLEESIAMYGDKQVTLASLEAFERNEKAIVLYEKHGYQVEDTLSLYSYSHSSMPTIWQDKLPDGYSIAFKPAADVREISYAPRHPVWQTDWRSLSDGYSVMMKNQEGAILGYALCRPIRDHRGHLTGIALMQCVHDPTCADPEATIRNLLQYVFTAPGVSRFKASHIPARHTVLNAVLQDVGFRRDASLVHMIRPI